MGRTTKWLKNFFGIKRDKEKNKQNSNFSVLFHNPATIPPNISPSEASWIQSFYTENEKEQNKHAIAVAAATAAAADAALAAAQAAVAVVRLTSNGRFCGRHEIWAAVKIQTVFRGYLARKALRALKGLVKLQAIVRGYLVRKQATRALHSVQALIRAQATIKSQKSHRLMNSKNEANRFQNLARRSMERFDDTRSEYMTASNHSRRLSCSNATINNNFDGINSPKIVEMDTISGRPKSRKSRTNNISKSDFDDNPSFYALSTSQQINYPTQDQRNFQESDWSLTGEECRFSTAQSTPRFTNSCSFGGSVIGPVTPKSVCNDNLLFREYGNFTKNYMASTQSFKAKLRSHSAPKQRPQSPKKRLSMNEMMESRNSFSGVRMQKSCSQAQEIIDFKNAVMGKLHKSNESIRDTDKNCFPQRML